MTAASTPAAADGPAVDRSRPVDRRLQLWGGGAAMLGTLLGAAPSLLALLGGVSALVPHVLLIAGGLLMVTAAALLAKAFVGDRAPFSLAKLGGILLITFHCWWLALALVPGEWLSAGGAAAGEGWNATRLLVGVLAGIAIATSWRAGAFNRWSMMLVAACFGLSIYGSYAAIVLLGPAGADVALQLSVLQPLSLLAFGLGHAISGWRATRASDAGAVA